MIPPENEPICLISFEVTKIRLGGGPEERRSFWSVYREELALNQRTQYENEHVRICRPMLMHLKNRIHERVFFRKNRLISSDDSPCR